MTIPLTTIRQKVCLDSSALWKARIELSDNAQFNINFWSEKEKKDQPLFNTKNSNEVGATH